MLSSKPERLGLGSATPSKPYEVTEEELSKMQRENQHQTCQLCQAKYYWNDKMRAYLSKPTSIKHLNNLLHDEKNSPWLPSSALVQTRMKQCSRCKKVTYCNDLCQRLDWQKHKEWCKPKPFSIKN
jgi:hypothetical protein